MMLVTGSLRVRYATVQDIDAAVGLLQRIAGMYDHGHDTEVMRASVEYALAHPERARFIVAETSKGIAGIASLHLGHFSTFTNTWYGHVEDVFVDPALRRRGIARSLLDFMEEEARKLQLSRLELHVLNDNLGARQLYEKYGFHSIDSTVYIMEL